jgi:hypothetical protein
MRLHPFWIAPFAALLAAGLVAADATRVGLDARRRLYWAVGVGLASLSGFLGASLGREPVIKCVVHNPERSLAISNDDCDCP